MDEDVGLTSHGSLWQPRHMTRSTGGDKTHLKDDGIEAEGEEEKKKKEMEQTSGFLRR